MKKTILLSITVFVSTSFAVTPSFQGLGDLSGGDYQSVALGISANGSTVVGYSNSASGQEAFRWEDGSMIGLGDLPGGIFSSSARAVSGDGSVIVGRCTPGGYSEAFRWTQTGGMIGLDGLVGSNANAVSGNGSIVVGNCDGEAFRWEDGSIVGLGYLPGYEEYSSANE